MSTDTEFKLPPRWVQILDPYLSPQDCLQIILSGAVSWIGHSITHAQLSTSLAAISQGMGFGLILTVSKNIFAERIIKTHDIFTTNLIFHLH